MIDEEKIKLESKIAFLENTVTIMRQRIKSMVKEYSDHLEKANNELLKMLQLQKENASLRARLEKAVELKDPYYVVDNDSGMIRLYYEKVIRYGELYEDLEEAESRLAELKGEQK